MDNRKWKLGDKKKCTGCRREFTVCETDSRNGRPLLSCPSCLESTRNNRGVKKKHVQSTKGPLITLQQYTDQCEDMHNALMERYGILH